MKNDLSAKMKLTIHTPISKVWDALIKRESIKKNFSVQKQ